MTRPKIELDGLKRTAEREWVVQRIGWVLWGGIILAALAGLVGPGPFSTATAVSSDGSTTISYNKYLHYHSPEVLKVTLQPDESTEAVDLFVSKTLLDNIEIRRIEPEPAKSTIAQDGIVYNFPTQPAAEPIKVMLHVEYQKFGSVSGEISLGEHPAAVLEQFVYP